MDATLRALFAQALELPASERARLVERVGIDDAARAAQLRALLDADATAQGVLDQSFAELAAALALPAVQDHSARLGSRIGPYRLLAVLGEGGMGVVYRAERADAGFAQTVALKLIRGEKLSPFARTRFLQERTILARMQHPHIAHLLDGGIGDHGEPWFAMEYIEGEPLQRWCDAQRLGIAARLRLVLDICAAIEYAHSRMVVHRDIKPGNVMVDASGTVKLLDFGIAKLLDKGEVEAFTTGTQMRLLTPEYAAPEQVAGADVTTATDVHALGLLIYELLCGRRAFRADEAASAFDVQREVLERDPPAMSLRLRQTRGSRGEDVARIAAQRGLDPAQLQRMLRGDLQHIVAKALRKEPEQRYPNVAALTEDIRQYLANRPVAAAGGARLYRLRKFIRRNRVAVTLAAVIVLLLAGALLAIRAQSQKLAQESRTTQTVRDYLEETLRRAAPEAASDRAEASGDLLENGVRRAEQLRDEPQAQAYLFDVLGNSYVGLGRYAEAEALFRKGRSVAIAALGESAPLTQEFDLRIAQAVARRNPGDAEANGLLDTLIAHQRQLAPAERGLIVPALIQRGANLAREDPPRALATLREAVAQAQRRDSAGEVDDDLALVALADALSAAGNASAAVSIFRELLQARERDFAPSSPWIARVRMHLSNALAQTGASADAEALLDRAAEPLSTVFGGSYPGSNRVLAAQGRLLLRAHRFAEADATLQRALAGARETAGEESREFADAAAAMSELKLAQNDFVAADRFNRAANAVYAKRLGAGAMQTLDTARTHAQIEQQQRARP